MKRFWVEFRHGEKTIGGYFEARNELGLRLFWNMGEILYISFPIRENADLHEC